MQEKHPISKYIGQFPNGQWVFVKEFEGSLEEAMCERERLQAMESNDCVKYCIWDDR